MHCKACFYFTVVETNGFRCWDFDLIDCISDLHWCYFSWTEWSLAKSPSFQILPMWTFWQSWLQPQILMSTDAIGLFSEPSACLRMTTLWLPHPLYLSFFQSRMFNSKILHMVPSLLAQLSSNLQASDNRLWLDHLTQIYSTLCGTYCKVCLAQHLLTLN